MTARNANEAAGERGDDPTRLAAFGISGQRFAAMTVPEQIRDARKAAGLTQKQLAAQLGIAQARISEYESGQHEPSASRFQKIMAVCEASTPPPQFLAS